MKTATKTTNSIDDFDGQTEIDVAQFAYDALGRRIWKYDPAAAAQNAYYYYNDSWQILCEYTDETVCRQWLTYGNYIDEVLSRNTSPTLMPAMQYYAHDHLYSPAALTNSTASTIWERYEYDAYGKVAITGCGADSLWYTADDTTLTASGKDNLFFFTGRQLDTLDSGALHHMHYRHRDYSPTIGRFMQQDPLGYINGLNLYEYVISNPLMNYDPIGSVCGSGWSEPLVPDSQYPFPNFFGNADFTKPCQKHDDCYGGTGHGGCNTRKEDCDKGLRDGMKNACEQEYSGWKRIALPGQYADCLLKAQIYYQAVKRMGQGAFDAARKNNPNCDRNCWIQSQLPVVLPTVDDFFIAL